MKTKLVRGKTTYVSDVMPAVRTTSARESAVLHAADERPLLYRIVTTGRSRAWGSRGAHYPHPSAIIERLSILLDALGRTDVLGESARFTAEHFDETGFMGSELVLHGKHPICTLTLDYTPATLPDVIQTFLRFAGTTPGMPASTVRVAGKIVHRLIDLAALAQEDAIEETRAITRTEAAAEAAIEEE